MIQVNQSVLLGLDLSSLIERVLLKSNFSCLSSDHAKKMLSYYQNLFYDGIKNNLEKIKT
jgi:hypothetical protein